MLIGPPSPRVDLIAVAILAWGDELFQVTDALDLPEALTPALGVRRLVIHGPLGESPYTALDAVRALHPGRGVKLVTWSETAPPDPWAQLMGSTDRQVELRLTPAELLAWVQITLGGTYAVTARELCERVGWRVEPAAAAVRRLNLVGDVTTLGDVRQLIDADPEVHFVAALLACKKRDAMALAPKVHHVGDVLALLEGRLLQLLQLAEVRPVKRLRHTYQIEGQLNIPRADVAALAPLVRLYSRQKVTHRLLALSTIDTELRRCTPNVGLLEALCTLW